MKLLNPGDPCPCCGRPIKEGLPTGTMIFLSWLAEGMALRKAAKTWEDTDPDEAVQNEPLTLEQLREMDGPVWVACKPIEGGHGYWCLCQRGTIITPSGNAFDVKEIPHWVLYRRPPEGEEGKR